jgi:hypothetical protein
MAFKYQVRISDFIDIIKLVGIARTARSLDTDPESFTPGTGLKV